MKFIARKMKVTPYATGGMGLSFDCGFNAQAQLLNLLELHDYNVEITTYREKRSKEQNALLWRLIGEICEVENGSKADTEEIYLQLLQETGAKVDFLQGIPESLPTLERLFRIVKVVDERESNGQKTFVFKCYSGSSMFDTKEMTKLIDKTIGRAEWDGIDVDVWREQLKTE